MKYPFTLNICGHPVKVEKGDLVNAYGYSNREANKIVIGNDAAPSQQLSAILHEIFEHLLPVIGYGRLADEHHEFVYQIENALFRLLQDNKTFIRNWLKEV